MISGTGSCLVMFDQAGNTNYNAAATVTETVNAVKAAQAITVTTHAPGSAVYGTQFTVAGHASSGGSVSYSSSGACTNVGATFTMISGTGSCLVMFDQAGNTNYNAAATVTETVNAVKAAQAITVTTHAPGSAVYGTQFTVAGHASSGGSVSYLSSGACTNVGATFTMISGTGSCLVMFDQAGNTNYNAAATVTETVNAVKAAQAITVTDACPGECGIRVPVHGCCEWWQLR